MRFMMYPTGSSDIDPEFCQALSKDLLFLVSKQEAHSHQW